MSSIAVSKLARLYHPPAGYYDLPFMWIFDASQLTDGSTFRNQRVPILAGYGDFTLRRIVGLDRVLSNAAAIPGQVNPPGQFQVRDSRGRYLQEVPTYIGTGGPGVNTQTSGDIAIVPELEYKENTQIQFDLIDVLRALDGGAASVFAAQIGFHGVRRVAGRSPLDAGYKYRPKHFMYRTTGVLVNPVSVTAGLNSTKPLQLVQAVDDYDFELRELRIVYLSQASAVFSGDHSLTIVAVAAGSAGNGITLTTITGGANKAFSISVDTLALTVTVQLQTDSGGNPVTTFAQLVQALNANLGVTALFVTNPTVDISTVSPFSITTAGGGGLVPNFQPNALIQLYDQNRVQVFSQAVNDMYINRLSPEANGAFVPPLFYRKDTLITMEVFSLQNAPVEIQVHYLGVRRVPC